MKIIGIRHLATEFNIQNKIQGSIDNPITSLSYRDKKQINEVLNYLKHFHLDKILVSEYKRTQQTAKAYGFNNYFIEPLTNELNFGQFEGKCKSELVKANDGAWINNPADIELGEHLYEFEKRILSFIEKYERYSTILLFSHGAFMRALYTISLGQDIRKLNHLKIANNEIIEVNL